MQISPEHEPFKLFSSRNTHKTQGASSAGGSRRRRRRHRRRREQGL